MIRPNPRSILSVDVGQKRIGIAGCDPLGITVTILPALKRKTFNDDFKYLEICCLNRKVEGLVFGLPLDQKGLKTRQSIHCEKYGKRMAQALKLPMAFVNEQCSTWVAEELHNLRNDRSGKLDSASAALLLEQWLKEGPELEPVYMAAYQNNNSSRNDRS